MLPQDSLDTLTRITHFSSPEDRYSSFSLHPRSLLQQKCQKLILAAHQTSFNHRAIMSEALILGLGTMLEDDPPDGDTAADSIEQKTAVVELRLEVGVCLEEMLK